MRTGKPHDRLVRVEPRTAIPSGPVEPATEVKTPPTVQERLPPLTTSNVLGGAQGVSLNVPRATVGGAGSALRARQLANKPMPKATTLDELLASIPAHSEVKRIEEARASRHPEGLPSQAELLARLPATHKAALQAVRDLTACLNPVEIYTIDDVGAVREQFLAEAAKGRPRNPTFSYRGSLARLTEALRQRGETIQSVADKLSLHENALASAPRSSDPAVQLATNLLLARLRDGRATLQLAQGLQAGDDALVRGAMAGKYGSIEPDLRDAANTVYAYLVRTQAHDKANKAQQYTRGSLPPDVVNKLTQADGMAAQQFADAVRFMLTALYERYEAKTGAPFPEALKFKVEVSNDYSSIDVRDKSSGGPVIGIPDKSRSGKKVLELLRHEVDMHVRQSLNGQLMLGLGGGALKTDEETWYEGLAKHAEIGLMRDLFGDESEPPLPYPIFAIALAEQGKSFVEVFEAVKDLRIAAGQSEKSASANAWINTYRVFRGHVDTGNSGAYAMAKDAAYLRGWIMQNQLADRGLSFLNESGIYAPAELAEIARFNFEEDDLLFPDANLTHRYMREVLIGVAD